MLVHRHGPLEASVFNRKKYSRSCKSSLWWKDLRSLGSPTEVLVDWFSKGISCRLGESRRVLFWKTKWSGSDTFQNSFPLLFNVSSQQNTLVSKIGFFIGESWLWRFQEEFVG